MSNETPALPTCYTAGIATFATKIKSPLSYVSDEDYTAFVRMLALPSVIEADRAYQASADAARDAARTTIVWPTTRLAEMSREIAIATIHTDADLVGGTFEARIAIAMDRVYADITMELIAIECA
jgi:hypothetical protein